MLKQAKIDINTLELLPVAVVLLDNNCIYYINQKALKLFKLPKHISDSISNLNFFEFINESYHKRIKQCNKEILKGAEFPSCPLPCFDFEKNELLVKVKSNAVIFNGKKVIQSTFFDISNELQNHNKLQRANALLENFNSNINDIIFEQSFIPYPHIKYISDSVFNILGKTPQQVYENQHVFLEQVHPDDKKDYVDSLLKLIEVKKRNKEYKKTFRFYHTNGDLMHLESVATPVYQKNKIIGLVGVIRNITTEKNQQIQLNQKWNNYKNLIDASPIGIVIHKGGPCLYINHAAAQILEENNHKKILGKELIHFIIPEQQKIAVLRSSEALKGNNQDRLIYTIKTVKGNIKQIELKSVPFIYNGEACVQTVISDVSLHQKLEEEKLRTKLAEKVNTVLVNVINERKKAEAKLDAIFSTSSHIIWTIDYNFKITSFNQNFYNHVKKTYNKIVKLNTDYLEFCKIIYPKKKFHYWIKKFNEAFLGNNIVFEIEVNNRLDEISYFEVFLNPIFNDKKAVQEVAIISHDITERKIQEEKIQQQAAKLQAIFDSGNQLLWTINKDLIFTSFNKNFKEAMFALYKIQPTTDKIYQPHKTKKGKEIHQWWIDKYKQVFATGKSIEFTTEQVQDNKEIHYRQIFFHPIFNKQGIIDEISCTSNDITELKYLQNQSFTQNAKLKSILESSSHLVWTINPDYCLTSFNTNFSKLFEFNYLKKPLLNEKLHTLIPEDKREDYQAFWYTNYKKAFSGKSLKIERRQINKQGALAFNEIYINPIKNSNNEIIEIACLAHDITENKLNEEKLIQSLKEKEVLLKEVHHRVKNNMQVISSILNLQSSYVKDAYALALLKESQNRIKSMSFIHESLYQTQNFEVVNFTDYIITLSKNLIHSYSVNLDKIKLNLNLDKLFLTLDVSIPCGLIINEIISNSLKYAFPNNQDGDIFLTLKENNNKICIEIGDNGIGIPNNIDIKHTETLGLQLVDTLVEQINATLVLDKSKGTKFLIEFNKISKNGK